MNLSKGYHHVDVEAKKEKKRKFKRKKEMPEQNYCRKITGVST